VRAWYTPLVSGVYTSSIQKISSTLFAKSRAIFSAKVNDGVKPSPSSATHRLPRHADLISQHLLSHSLTFEAQKLGPSLTQIELQPLFC
jgi:hypothetical protein